MKIKSSELLKELELKTLQMIETAKGYKLINLEDLNKKPAEDKWSILECIQHINLYGDIYVKEIRNRISKAKRSSEEFHKTGLIGNYAAKTMLPKGDIIPNKMKTFKSMTPKNSNLTLAVIDKFISQQKDYLKLIEHAHHINLTKTKCGLAIKGLKFRMGDAMRFYSFHNVRHIVQANKILGNNPTS